MRVLKSGLLALSMGALTACSTTQAARPGVPQAEAQLAPPKLLVAISVDQLSSELFEAYAPHFSDGVARIAGGTSFLAGYQAQAATETCPGHSTILTGSLPARTGIVANDWYDAGAPRDDKEVYCAEDVAVAGDPYTVSPTHLLVPTLGELMKAANPASRNVAVAGKDRAAVMMGGRTIDARWYWGGKDFTTDQPVTDAPATIAAVNAATAALVASGIPALELPWFCADWDRPYTVGKDTVVGNSRLALAANKPGDLRRHPAFDGAVLALAAGLIEEMKLGRGEGADLLSIGLSATDYVGHAYGTHGAEMCLQLAGLDRSLGDFLRRLDASGIDYAVVLTADHGGGDVPGRVEDRGLGEAAYVDPADPGFAAAKEAVASRFGIAWPIVYGGASGDQYLDPAALAAHGEPLVDAVAEAFRAHGQVDAVFTEGQIMAQPIPTGDPARWSLIERVRASYRPDRSGDLYVVLKPRIMPIPNPGGTYTATHGTAHDYDRRVPILFWRNGAPAVVRPDSAATTDIMPTLAAMIGIGLDPAAIDGRCLDGVPGVACPGN